MEIDPVVALAEQLRSTERCLDATCKGWHDERMVELRTASLVIRRMLETTQPTSAMGASELIAIAADRLGVTDFPYIADLRSVGERFGDGRRILSDLIWLRAVVASLETDSCGERGKRTAAIIRLAIDGASKPLLIFRAAPDLREEDGEPDGNDNVTDFRPRFGDNPPLSALCSVSDRNPAGR